MNIKYCPECKNKINEIDMNANGQKIYFCSKCKNKFIIDSDY